MANIVLVLGKSGTGKSTSMRSLDPKTTVIFNTLSKRLPFKGASKMYNADEKNLYALTDYQKLCMYLNGVSERRPEVKDVVIDDATYIMRNEFFDRAKENGYNKFTDIAQHFKMVLDTAMHMRDDINVYLMFHSEDVSNDGKLDTVKCATVGKMLDEKFNPMECVSICLVSDIRFSEEKTEYGFYTRPSSAGGKFIPAKSPEGMFEGQFIPNDLALVSKAINEYFN